MPVMDNRQMNRMRQEAIRRSQEMHKRSMVNASHYSQGNSTGGDRPPENSQIKPEGAATTPQTVGQNRKNELQLSEIIDGIFHGKLDSDKLMILLLMIVLIKEGADMKLILALAYILL